MRRTAHTTALVIMGLILSGFVHPPEKLLKQAREAAPRISKPLKIAWNGRPGTIAVGRPGKHAIVFDDGERLADPGLPAPPPEEEAAPGVISGPAAPNPAPQVSDPLFAFWRMLDFYSPARPEDFVELLAISGVDVNRRGLVRMDREGEKLAYTIGAMGESEPGRSQLWIEKDTGRPVLLALGDRSFVTAGPPGPGGAPQWFKINGDWAKLTIIVPDAPEKGR